MECVAIGMWQWRGGGWIVMNKARYIRGLRLPATLRMLPIQQSQRTSTV